MTKYLIESWGFEYTRYHGFESELSLEDLNRSLNRMLSESLSSGRDKNVFDFIFEGYRLTGNEDLNWLKIITLEDFWQESLIKS